MPSAARSLCASGISPSPQALSMGGRRASATRTSKPFCRSAIAAARPAGPPPTMSASQRITLPPYLPLQQQHLGAESRAHGCQHAARSRLGAGDASSLRSRTTSTEAEDRLPTRCSASHDSSSSPLCSPNASATASSTLGPPGCMIQESNLVAGHFMLARKASTSRPRFSRTTVGTSGESTT